MADAIVRLKVESQEYDQKLSRATQQLQHMEKEVRRTGATFAYADEEELAFIKSLGSMETQATSARGKMSELTKTFTELSIQYKNLTDEEKNSPFGKAMAGSIDQIKGRIGDLGGQLKDVSGELQSTGGFIDKLADGLGQLGPIGQMAGRMLKGALGPIGIAIAAVVGFVQQLVSAFKRNEDAMASVGRAAAPFKAIWQGIQQLFDKLVVSLATVIEKVSSGLQSMFDKITDWMGKLADTKLGKKLGLDDLHQQLLQVKQAQDELTKSNEKIATQERELKALRRKTDEGNADRRAQISELRYKASDKTNYSASDRVGFLEKAQELEAETLKANVDLREKELELIKLKNSLTQSGTDDLDAETAAVVALKDARTQYNDHVRATQKALETARKEAELEAQASDTGQGTSGTTPAADSIAAQEEEVKRLTELWKNAGEQLRDGYKQQLDEATKKLEEMRKGSAVTPIQSFNDYQKSIQLKIDDRAKGVDTSSLDNLMTVALQNKLDVSQLNFEGLQQQLARGINIPDEAWENLTSEINEKLAELGIKPIELDVKTGGIKDLDEGIEKTTDHVAGAAQAFSALGNAMNQIDDPGAKVAGMIAEAIGSVAAGYGTATAQAATLGPWAWIAFAVTGLATMISTIEGIKQATAGAYAEGGIIPGNSFSGDNLTANVNSGELILNRAQQDNIAGQLSAGNAFGNLRLSTNISGSDLRIVLNNDNRQRGGSRNVYGVH